LDRAARKLVGDSTTARDSANKQQIAVELDRHPGSVGREINRNKDPITGLYSGIVAEEKAKTRQKNATRKLEVITTLSSKAYYTILEELQKRTSPEQIAAIISEEIGEPISHQAIYNYIGKDKANGGKLYLYLRRKGRRYRYCKKEVKVLINDKKSIEVRPLKLALLQSFGNWEIDTIFGKDQKSFLLTIVEMRTKYTIIRKIANKEAATVKAEIDKIMVETGIVIKTMTSDNGGEFGVMQLHSMQGVSNLNSMFKSSIIDEGMAPRNRCSGIGFKLP
jgi:IS30 family transposase